MSSFLSQLFQHPDEANQPPADGSQTTTPQNPQQPADQNGSNFNPSNSSPTSNPALPSAGDVTSTIAQAKQDSSVVSSSVDPVKEQEKTALSHMDPRASQVLVHAYEETKKIKQSFIEPEQLFLALISDREIFKLLQDFKVDVAKLTRDVQQQEKEGTFAGEPTLGEQTKQILEEAFTNAKKREVAYLSPEDILLVFFSKQTAVTAPLKKEGVEKSKIEEKLSKSTEFKTGKKSVIEEYGVDLTEKARKGLLDPVTGRDKEVERMVHILLRRTKNNPVIIGEAGVGKTALVEGLAQMMADGKVTPDLARRRIIQLDISSLIAGASHRGEFEERLQGVIKEVMASQGQIVLFIDEIHTLLGAGSTDGAMDASNIVKPYLSRGQIQIIGATTTSEFRKNFEKDRAFERRFQPIVCDEPTEEVAIQMIKVLQPKYEKFHGVKYSDESIKAAVHLSKRYVGERFLPDKAIDLMDEAAAEVKLNHSGGVNGTTSTPVDPDAKPAEEANKQTDPNAQAVPSEEQKDPSKDNNLVTDAQSSPNSTQNSTAPGGAFVVQDTDIEKVVSRWTGIPITKLTEKESEKLLHMEDIIHKNFINHERAVTAVSEAIRRGRIGLASASRPIASFIFLGPTGTGKTELAKVLAEIMFGKKDAMIRLDMSEYMEKHEVAKLVGAPPGYVGYEEGGQLTEAVRAKPYSIVLLDEIEKAHPDVFNILLQLLEDGRLTDNKGNTISFKNTVIIATSNIGSTMIQQKLQELNAPTGSPMTNDPASATQSMIPPSPGTEAAAANPTPLPGAPVGPNQPVAAAPGQPVDPNNPVAQTVSPVPGSPAQDPSVTPAQTVPQTPAVPGAVTPPPVAPANSIVSQVTGEDADPATVLKNKVFKELSGIVMQELTKHFRPELINRFDEVVIFEPLSQENMMQIARLGIEGTKKMLKEQGIDLQISETALSQLAKEGYDPAYGARPLRRLIQRSIENPIAIYLIERSAGEGDTIMIDYDSSKDAYTFTKQAGANAATGAQATAAPPVAPDGSIAPMNEQPSQTGAETLPQAPTGIPGNLPIDEAPPEITSSPADPNQPVPPPADGGAGQAKQLPDWLENVTETAQGTGEAPQELVDAGSGGGAGQATAVGGTT